MAEDERMALYRRGLSDRQIAEAVGVTPGAICAWRRGRGLPPNRRRRSVTREEIERMVEMFRGGASYYRIAKEMGRGPALVRSHLRKLGLRSPYKFPNRRRGGREEKKEEILRYVSEKGVASPADIAGALKISAGYAQQLIWELAREGRLRMLSFRDRGRGSRKYRSSKLFPSKLVRAKVAWTNDDDLVDFLLRNVEFGGGRGRRNALTRFFRENLPEETFLRLRTKAEEGKMQPHRRVDLARVMKEIEREKEIVEVACRGLVHPDQADRKEFTRWLRDVVIFHLDDLKKRLVSR